MPFATVFHMHCIKLSYLIEHPGRSHAVPRSTTEAQWSSAATPASPSLLEGFVALVGVVTLKTRMSALATPPRALVIDPMEAKVLPLARAARLEVLFGVVGGLALLGGVLVVEGGAKLAIGAGARLAVPFDGALVGVGVLIGVVRW